MSANWSLPTLSDLYTNFRQYLSDRLDDSAKMFNSATVTATNLPTGTIRWNSTSSKFEIWSGSAWSDLAATYGISITGSSGSCTGNAATATSATTATTCSGTAANANTLGGVAAGSLSVNYATSAGSAPASDVYPWAKAPSPPATGVPYDCYGGVGYFALIGWASTDGSTTYQGAVVGGNFCRLASSGAYTSIGLEEGAGGSWRLICSTGLSYYACCAPAQRIA